MSDPELPLDDQGPVKRTMTAREVVTALERRYSRPEFFFVSEATIEGRRFDGLAVGCYATHGWPILGFEVKVSRSDWLAELADPAKSDILFNRCDEWYIVAPEGIVRADEVPVPWGWIRVSPRGCRVMKAAPKHGPAPVDREFCLRMLFKRDEWWHEESRRRLREQADGFEERIQGAEKAAQDKAAGRYADAPAELERLRKAVADFEGASGIQIREYGDNAKIGRAAQLVRGLVRQGGWSSERIVASAKEIIESANELEAEIAKSVGVHGVERDSE